MLTSLPYSADSFLASGSSIQWLLNFTQWVNHLQVNKKTQWIIEICCGNTKQAVHGGYKLWGFPKSKVLITQSVVFLEFLHIFSAHNKATFTLFVIHYFPRSITASSIWDYHTNSTQWCTHSTYGVRKGVVKTTVKTNRPRKGLQK